METVKVKNITLSRILKIIKESKLTAKDFAKNAGIAGNSITDWKTGRSKPSINALRKISKTYKVQLEWLTGDSKYRTKEEEFNDYKTKEEQMKCQRKKIFLKTQKWFQLNQFSLQE